MNPVLPTFSYLSALDLLKPALRASEPARETQQYIGGSISPRSSTILDGSLKVGWPAYVAEPSEPAREQTMFSATPPASQPSTLAQFGEGLSTVAPIVAWISSLGRMEEIQGFHSYPSSEVGFPEKPHNYPIAQYALRAWDGVNSRIGFYGSAFALSLGMCVNEAIVPQDPKLFKSFPDLLSALQALASMDHRVEYGIVEAYGHYAIYQGNEFLTNSDGHRLVLHTHMDGTAVPSSGDLRALSAQNRHYSEDWSLIYSQPYNKKSHQLSFIKPHDSGSGTFDVWLWESIYVAEKDSHVLNVRKYNLGVQKGLFVLQEQSPVTSRHLRTVRQALDEDEQQFWTRVLSSSPQSPQG